MTQSKIKRKWGCGMPLLAIVILVPAVHLGEIWWLQNPKHMLSRFLDVEWTEQITRVNSSYRSGIDYVAQIYLEADSTITERIISRGDFSQTDLKSSLLNFEGAPPTASEQLTYYKKKKAVCSNTSPSVSTAKGCGMRRWNTKKQ